MFLDLTSHNIMVN